MAFITVRELLDLALMTLLLGYIFLTFMPRERRAVIDLVRPNTGFDWESYKLAIIVTAPAVVLHELAHKFVAIGFGVQAIFKASYFGLMLGVFLKIISSPIIIFAPGYVIFTPLSPYMSAMTAFAGPAVNLLLFLAAKIILGRAKLTRNQAIILHMTKQINLFLFIFNMLPIPPLDGSKVFGGLIKAIA